MRLLHVFSHFERRLFEGVNRHFDKKRLNLFFRTITHFGGASFTILSVLVLMLLSSRQVRITAIASALALTLSHIPVHVLKKLFPRKRPYLVLERTKYPSNPLKDHSFPSGHTTAIFSIMVPFVLLMPSLAIILIPLGFSVALSRIYLGLHYPSDVLAGIILGSFFGELCVHLLNHF
jgi:undecaprenyl-diphosphatase